MNDVSVETVRTEIESMPAEVVSDDSGCVVCEEVDD